LGVSSARFAAVSKPTNTSTPYSTPKKIPDQPSAAEDGLNGLRLFADPSLTMTVMKKMVTMTIDTSARASWVRVDTRTPKYRMPAITAIRISVQTQDGIGFTPNSLWIVLCRYPPMSSNRPVSSTVTPP
jgi:hypothetical protein